MWDLASDPWSDQQWDQTSGPLWADPLVPWEYPSVPGTEPQRVRSWELQWVQQMANNSGLSMVPMMVLQWVQQTESTKERW
jgi:hypothetical protein